jgi:DNA polymerase-3 subunit chi
MAEARFYQLAGNLPADVDAFLPGFLDKLVGDGKRVLLIGADNAVSRLDERLWPAGAGFLPHGRVGEGEEARQPVLLAGVAQGRDYLEGRLAVVVAGAEEAFDIPAESMVYVYHAAVAESAAKRRDMLAGQGWVVSFFQQTERGWKKAS